MFRAIADSIPPVWIDAARQLGRFGIVGVAATAVHASVALTYFKLAGGGALPANLFGFCIAFGVSLAGNMLWVFPGRGRSSVDVIRFFAVALTALGATCTISWLFDHLHYEPRLSLFIVVMTTPAISYCGNRFWVFAR